MISEGIYEFLPHQNLDRFFSIHHLTSRPKVFQSETRICYNYQGGRSDKRAWGGGRPRLLYKINLVI